MERVRVIEGTALPIDRSDVDTDQIIPAEHLKRIERTGFGPFLFAEWRKDPGFVINDPRYSGASILLGGPNFGCGSSREHAPWAIEDAGFKAVIAPSFGDIFRNNCTKIGLLPVELPAESVRALMDAVIDDPSTRVVVDLKAKKVAAPGLDVVFEIDDFTRRRLLEGLDDIGLTLRVQEKITAYESARPSWMPTTQPGAWPRPAPSR
jgi:3-isopropylmalate/(R)-2-methylmalate dehydratase small subunit